MPGTKPATRPGDPASVPTERPSPVPGPSRLLAQRGLFTGPSTLVPEDLYALVVRGVVTRERHRLVLAPNAEASTNTYFGRFPATYWQRWTSADEVEATVVASGSGRVRLVASDANGEPRTLTAVDIAGVGGADGADHEAVTLSARIDRFVDGGAMWLEFVTEAGDLTVDDLRWTVRAAPRHRETAMVICTCNRVTDCLNTLSALAADQGALDALAAVYVADQGSDPIESRPEFAEVSAALRGKLRYIRQPNLGGAGGFTRGLYEFFGDDSAEHTNVLFMDDDVLCEPDIVVRLTAFADRMVEPVIIGGQMLYLLHPKSIHVGAETADLEKLTPGIAVKDALFNADLTGEDRKGRRNVQDRRVDAGYNGWWACLIPAEIVHEIGYPLPLFFQWDDVEYGYRARAHGFATVTLPGAGVWHADFHWKDWDEWHRYFNLRNSLITGALHSRFKPSTVVAVLADQLGRYLLGMQYGLAVTLIKAVEDFLAGPDFLDDGGASAMREIRAVRADYPETVRHAFSDLPGLRSGEVPMIRSGPEPHLIKAVLLKRIVYQLLGKTVHRAGAIPAGDAEWWHVSLFDTAVVTDASQEGVRVRRRDRELAIRLAKQGALVLRRLLKEAPRAQQEYRAALPRLAGRENWARLYRHGD